MAENNSTNSSFKPYIAPSDFIPEFTPKAIILGAIFGIIFGAATVYLGLKLVNSQCFNTNCSTRNSSF